MAGYGPPEDPSRQPTRRADLNARGYPPPGPADPSAAAPPTGSYAELKPDESEPPAPTPWYRRRVVLITWGLLILALMALILYGLIDLAGRGHGGPGPTHTTTTTPTTTATTTTTTSPSPSSSTEEAPPPPSGEPPQAPAPPAPPPAGTAPPSHRHHLPRLPPTITVPGGPVITLPPHR